jgi:hypothetical protein
LNGLGRATCWRVCPSVAAPRGSAGERPIRRLGARWRVARRAAIEGGRDSLEFPIGHVLYKARGWLSNVSVSPKGDRVAFFEHPSRSTTVGTSSSWTWRDQDDPLERLGGPLRRALDADGSELWFSASGGGGKTAGDRPRVVRRHDGGAGAYGDERTGQLDLEDIAATDEYSWHMV